PPRQTEAASACRIRTAVVAMALLANVEQEHKCCIELEHFFRSRHDPGTGGHIDNLCEPYKSYVDRKQDLIREPVIPTEATSTSPTQATTQLSLTPRSTR
ncbi:hypothetical protein, partial [Sinorhizobium fredii]|uniref:hypothetical protein n=1 Tax=Rhizobium fredii TaxID=380 RepID=UPI001AEC1159